MKLEDGLAGLEGDEVLVAVHQLEGVLRRRIAEAVVEAGLELLVGLFVLADAHEVEAELAARGVQAGVDFESLAVESDGLVIPTVEHHEAAGGGVAGRGMRIPGGFL